MSTSISFAISSADQEAPTSKSFVDLRKDTGDSHLKPNSAVNIGQNEPYERRHTGVGSTGAEPDYFDLGPNKLRRWRHHAHKDSLSDSKSISREDEDVGDFYEEVDDRMSRNSLEYPEHQAKYIDRWLKDVRPTEMRSRSFDDDESFDYIKGNVIGIRGFASENSIASNRYNKLKSEYLRLQAEHNKLRSQFDEASRQHKRISRRRDTDLEALKTLVMKQTKRLESNHDKSPGQLESRCKHCNASGRSRGSLEVEMDKLRYELRRLELKYGHREKEHEDKVANLTATNVKLHLQVEAGRAEVENLQKQIKGLSLEPQNRILLGLRNENVRLRDTNETDQVEFRVLQDNYAQLDRQMRSICQEQDKLDNERNAETSRMFVELCRLQVYQPKLETLIETERKIKQELQVRLDSLQRENEQLQERNENIVQDLNLEKSRTRALESVEIEAVHGELRHLRDRYQRLEREKQDADELLRLSNCKVAQLDRKHQKELDSLREENQFELEHINGHLNKVSLERDSLLSRVEELRGKLELSEKAAGKLNEQLVELHKRLELSGDNDANREKHNNKLELLESKLKVAEDKMNSLVEELQTSETKRREAEDELADKRNQLEQSTRQVAELRRRLELQLATLEELREKKDKELARLRVDLNFEQYNRQVAMKGLERELRASLKELETMKYRFSKRLNVESDPTAGPVRLNGRAVRFDAANCCEESLKMQQPPQDSRSPLKAGNSVAAKLITEPNREAT